MIYDHTGSSIKNYIIEFLGSCEQYLRDDHGICSACVFVLNKLLYLRKCMYLIVASARGDDNSPNFKFAYVYKHFLENLQKLSYEECDTEADNNLSELLRPVHSSPYEEELEARYDREVEDTIRRRRGRSRGRGKRRGHNWTRYKNSGVRTRSRMTTYSEPAHGTGRVHSSAMNFSEYYDSERFDSDDENDNEVAVNMENAERHLNGILRNRRTCFSPRLDGTTIGTIPKYTCINGCSFEFNSLEEMTNHKIDVHGMLANYVCYECYATKFVSPEDLKLHNDLQHHTLISHCFLCSMELRTIEDLQKHLREHRFHSYPCHYCDMFFLDRQTCKTHIMECHKAAPNKTDNHIVMEVSDSPTESSAGIPSELIAESGDQTMEMNCNETESNSEGVSNPLTDATTTDTIDVGTKAINYPHKEINEPTLVVNGVLDIPDIIPEIMTETDVYTSEEVENNIDFSSKPGTSDSSSTPQNRNNADILITSVDSFERFIRKNNTKDDELDETKSNAKTLNNRNKSKRVQHLNNR
ncbi:hypothetical protein Trydic_g7699 [Trypoxylus dichotomus]